MKPKPPAHLSATAKREWKRFHDEFQIDPDARPILIELLESLDRKRQAQAELRKAGITVKNRFGELRPHPATSIERDARLAVLRCYRALGLPLADEKGKRAPGRPTLAEARHA